MAVKKKPSEIQREKLIENGETLRPQKKKVEYTNIVLRIPTSLLNEIDNIKRMGFTRTIWILDAIQDHLEKHIDRSENVKDKYHQKYIESKKES